MIPAIESGTFYQALLRIPVSSLEHWQIFGV